MLWDILVSIFWFMLLFGWIWLLVMIFSDLFRDHELSGWAKAAWALFLIVLPWLGALVYLIARGRSMNERPASRWCAISRISGGTCRVSQEVRRARPTSWRSSRTCGTGVISLEEFAQARARLIGTPAPSTANSHVGQGVSVG